ncbi:MAG: hypothetical protein COB02_17425 [Candidatus Cloacimonadota bacterium]|nr:MAG: hypothetical protein COB02_17425 [Candidatus Cloacimonadota bacterium]
MSALIDHTKIKQNAYTLEEASKLTKIGSFTLNMYLKSFSSHISILKNNKDSQILNSSIPILQKIRDLYRSGKSTEEIRSSLSPLINNKATKNNNVVNQKTHIIQTLIAQKNEICDIRKNQKKFENNTHKRFDQKAEYFQVKLEEVSNKSQVSYKNCIQQLNSFQKSIDNNSYFKKQLSLFEQKLQESIQEQTKKNTDIILDKVKTVWEKQQKSNQHEMKKIGSRIENWESLIRPIIDHQIILKQEMSSLKKQIDKHQHDGIFAKIYKYFKK